MITNTRTNFKANSRYTIRYVYTGFDGKSHIAESVVRGRNERDALVTLEGILGRNCENFKKTWELLREGKIGMKETFCATAIKEF